MSSLPNLLQEILITREFRKVLIQSMYVYTNCGNYVGLPPTPPFLHIIYCVVIYLHCNWKYLSNNFTFNMTAIGVFTLSQG